jgi:hypothetical protein
MKSRPPLFCGQKRIKDHIRNFDCDAVADIMRRKFEEGPIPNKHRELVGIAFSGVMRRGEGVGKTLKEGLMQEGFLRPLVLKIRWWL